MDGFISVERFQSPDRSGQALVAVVLARRGGGDAIGGTRTIIAQSQAAGRGGVFADYRLRIAAVVRDYGMAERGEAPAEFARLPQ